jgi:hypothetical protein
MNTVRSMVFNLTDLTPLSSSYTLFDVGPIEESYEIYHITHSRYLSQLSLAALILGNDLADMVRSCPQVEHLFTLRL